MSVLAPLPPLAVLPPAGEPAPPPCAPDTVVWHAGSAELRPVSVPAECPSYARWVPKSYVANLEFRKSVIRYGSASKRKARDVWSMCRRDLLFYVNVFGWLLESRFAGRGKRQPFITFPYQDELLLEIKRAIGRHDLIMPKSRDMGATWCCLYVMEWLWHFHDHNRFLLLSRDQDLVFKSGDEKSLFQKIDFIHRHQPWWLLPAGRWLGPRDANFIRNYLRNPENSSEFTGEATTTTAGHGDRCTAALLDEFAEVRPDIQAQILAGTRDVTSCRLFNSSVTSATDTFWGLVMDPRKRVLRIHWTLHPFKRIGLYYDQFNQPRNPWWEGQAARALHPWEIPQQLDINPYCATKTFFSHARLEELKREFCRDPFYVGMLDYDRELCRPVEFESDTAGAMKLWFVLDGDQPPESRYVIGCDVSQGTGATCSTAVVVDTGTNEKVAEYSNAHIEPHEFGRLAVALARWFHNAKLIWESPGPGRNFGSAVMDSGYRAVYWRRDEERLSKPVRDIPGWHPTSRKVPAFNNYKHWLEGGYYLNRSIEAVNECYFYLWTERKTVEHSRALTNLDPSASGENHGDLATADMLACLLLQERKGGQTGEPDRKAPLGSAGWRRDEGIKRDRAVHRRSRWW